MLKLTVKELKDYQLCGRLYDYRYVDKLTEKIGGRDLTYIRYENALKSIVNFFFYKKQSGSVPSYASLLNRWEKIWYPKGTTAYDITHEQHESFYGNNASLTSRAASALLAISENFSDSGIIPIAIDEEFIVPVNNKVAITDKFDLIYHYNKKVYVVKWVFNIKFKKQYLYSTDFAVMNMSYFSKYGNKIDITEFGYYDLLNPKPNFTKFESKKEDLETVDAWCSTLYEDKLFLPRRGMISYCTSCPHDAVCSKWNISTKKDGQINVK
jgi:hypothetical protein